MKLIIGNKAYSSWSLRGWLACRQSGLSFEEVVVPLYDAEWERRRDGAEFAPSSGKVPILWDGDVVVWDSLAIIEFLADRTGRDRFWPADEAARAMARSTAAEMHSSFTALRRKHSMNIRQIFPPVTPDADVIADLTRIMQLWADARARWGGNGAFLFGEFGAADIMFAPVCTRIVTYSLPVPRFAQAYIAAVLQHPFLQDWIAGAQEEDWVIEQFEQTHPGTQPVVTDALALARALIACDSVTPARGRVFDVLEAALRPLGFAVERFVEGEAPDGPVENLLATRGGSGPHLAFAGHVDVVPPGKGWTGDAFTPEVRGGLLYGRGAVDMKGAIAAFVAATAQAPNGRVSLIITGDEEGPATYGTQALLTRLAERGVRPDLCLVGEPTSDQRFGDTIKIGRRGSTNIWIDIPGRQGHVAYPHLADNPIPKLIAALAEMDAIVLDGGSAWFQPSNIEVTDLTVGNPATNVIPALASARLSIRFNDRQRGDDLIARVAEVVHRHAPDATVRGRVYGEAFLTEPGALSTIVADSVEARLGFRPALSTTGGTSDARFLSKLCPTIEFGLVNATMHKIDEAVAVEDLAALADIYAEVIRRATIGG